LKLASTRGNERATEVLQLELGGRSLADALRYVLNVPFEDRYVQHQMAKRADGPDDQPRPYRIVTPVYPQALRVADTEGRVIVDFVVDTTGRVRNAYSVKATHPLFAERAVKAVEQWRFYPGRRAGRLVNTHMQVPVIFQLTEEEMLGLDGLLTSAHEKAEELGTEVAADAADLRLARPNGRLYPPVGADGRTITTGRALVLLVLDPTGHPIRGHVLNSEPAGLGDLVLATALRAQFMPRIVDGVPVTSNVVLPFAGKSEAEKVLK
jgi:protein TonB